VDPSSFADASMEIGPISRQALLNSSCILTHLCTPGDLITTPFKYAFPPRALCRCAQISQPRCMLPTRLVPLKAVLVRVEFVSCQPPQRLSPKGNPPPQSCNPVPLPLAPKIVSTLELAVVYTCDDLCVIWPLLPLSRL